MGHTRVQPDITSGWAVFGRFCPCGTRTSEFLYSERLLFFGESSHASHSKLRLAIGSLGVQMGDLRVFTLEAPLPDGERRTCGTHRPEKKGARSQKIGARSQMWISDLGVPDVEGSMKSGGRSTIRISGLRLPNSEIRQTRGSVAWILVPRQTVLTLFSMWGAHRAERYLARHTTNRGSLRAH